MRGWIGRTAQVHGNIGILQALMLEASEGMRGWIARIMHGPQEHGPETKASKPLQEDCKWMRGWIARKA